MRLSYGDTSVAVLLALYELFASDVRTYALLHELHAILGKSVSKNLLRAALQELSRGDLVYFGKGAEDETDWRITTDGIEAAERNIKGGITLNSIVPGHGLAEFVSGELPILTDDDISDSGNEDIWEPLPLERESEAYKEAVGKVEEATTAIAGNNGYAETEPEERERVVWSLQAGLAQIKEGLPSRSQVREMLIKPLRYIGTKFAGASIGELAKAAAKALWTWISSL